MFLLQQGWGMLSAISPFLNNHTNSGVIISPRICEKDQLDKYLPEFKKIGKSKILFDPQFYEPRTDMDRILSYPYFKNFDFNTGSFKAEDFCADVINYQKDYLGLDEIIIPGRFSNGIGEQWLEMNYTFAKTASDIANHKILYSTIAIGPDVISNNESFDSLIDEIINYPVQGIYLVFENRPNSYFIDEEMLYILLDAVLSISLSGKKVLIGFGHQQHLALYAAGMDMLASGNWRNVRSFSLQNFTQQDNENLRKAIWYFDGNSLGEYRLQAISLAFRRGLGNLFGSVTDHA
ncbi:MAG TPA: hypothetical protein PLD55_15130, partial [bacterium]|nr:hypothetical protein [bacterium]